MAGAGLNVAVGVNLGKGSYGGLDSQGRFFHDTMTAHGIDMSATYVHPGLPTGTTFIHKVPAGERGGIAYFPNANHDFDFERFKTHVARLEPRIVYYMYSGLSRRGDAKDGRDLADFMRWCRKRGALTIADCHTLTGSPDAVIRSGRPVDAYKLLVPLLPEVDIFFTSSDEARMIGNTLLAGGEAGVPGIPDLLQALYVAYRGGESRTRVFGITVQDGAYEIHARPDGAVVGPAKVASRFMDGGVIDLVGAGDAFRAGLLAYIARNLEGFRHGSIDFAEAVQMGNLFAARFIKAPLGNRYAMKPYETMLKALSGPAV
jgi:sugar/nucleoside kinase (ribokinase family)